jgi:hypothetical protein
MDYFVSHASGSGLNLSTFPTLNERQNIPQSKLGITEPPDWGLVSVVSTWNVGADCILVEVWQLMCRSLMIIGKNTHMLQLVTAVLHTICLCNLWQSSQGERKVSPFEDVAKA